MAIYNLAPYSQGPYYHPTDGLQDIASAAAARVYASGDIVNLCKIERGMKLMSFRVVAPQLDSNGSPTLAAVLEIIDGATTTTAITVTAAQFGAAAGLFGSITNPVAYNYVCQVKDVGTTIRLRFTAGPATGVSAILKLGVSVTGLCFGAEEVTAPIG